MFYRDILQKIQLFLHTDDILLLYGARQVGKATLMKYIQQHYFQERSIFIDLEKESNLSLLHRGGDIFVEYLTSYHGWQKDHNITVFIDEVQYLQNPTSFLKYMHDNYATIKLIVSGSSTLDIRGKLKDSLVGRMITFDILPLSFQEFLRFKQKDNIAKLVGTRIDLPIINEEIKFFYEEYIKFGGYPKVVLANDMRIKKEYLKQIYSTYIQKDIKDIGKIQEVEKFNMVLKILARQSGSLVNASELSNTVGVTIKTINHRILLLENTFVIQKITPFSTNMRGELTKMPKVFFIDNGLRNHIDNSYFDINGHTFETSIFTHINNAYMTEDLHFYRTQDKKEIDFIINNKPFEVKLQYTGKKLTALEYFERQYTTPGQVITLQKPSKPVPYTVIYPWEIKG